MRALRFSEVHQQLPASFFREEADDPSMAWLALLACRVARHRWPVSAKATA